MVGKRILIYTNLDSDSDAAVAGAREFWPTEARLEIHVLYVLRSQYRFHAEIIEPGLSMDLNPQRIQGIEKALAERYIPLLPRAGRKSFHVRVGDPGVEVLRLIRSQRIHGLLMPLSRNQRGAPGELVEFLTRRCPCPILFLHPGRIIRTSTPLQDQRASPLGHHHNVIQLEAIRRRRASEMTLQKKPRRR